MKLIALFILLFSLCYFLHELGQNLFYYTKKKCPCCGGELHYNDSFEMKDHNKVNCYTCTKCGKNFIYDPIDMVLKPL